MSPKSGRNSLGGMIKNWGFAAQGVAIVSGGIILITAATAGYLVVAKERLSVDSLGQNWTLMYDGKFRAAIKDQNVGCCQEFCGETSKADCDDLGGSWAKGGCSLVSECDQGCCLPYCETKKKPECEAEGAVGSFVAKSCNQLNECDKGCCQVDCQVKENMAKAACDYTKGKWNKGACVTGCCYAEGTSSQLPEETCKCQEGATWTPGECAKGFKVSIDETKPLRVSFQRSMTEKLGGMINRVVESTGKPEMDMRLKLDAYTCAETVFSKWHVEYTMDSSASETQAAPSKFWVDFSQDPEYKISGYVGAWSGDFMKLEVSPSSMTMSADPIFSDAPLIYVGQIQKGAEEECKKQ